MALPSPYTNAADVIAEHHFVPEEFDWDNRTDGAHLDLLVRRAILDAQIQVYQVVGATNYTSTDDITLASVKLSEFDLACALMLRKRAAILASRPEESPPREEIELGTLMELIRDTEVRANARLVAYQSDEQAENTPGLGFSMGVTGVDETELDTSDDGYAAIDYGTLPS